MALALLHRQTRAFTSMMAPRGGEPQSALQMSDDGPDTFRDAEVLGLRLMQDGNYEEALDSKFNASFIHSLFYLSVSKTRLSDHACAAFRKGLTLPGSKNDVIRKKMLSGPSPVGGSMGGYESKEANSLDEFELQAAHYNMACAHAQLGNPGEAIGNLEIAFKNGFDNFATARSDPDLEPIQNEKDFTELMENYDQKKGFNPFNFLGK